MGRHSGYAARYDRIARLYDVLDYPTERLLYARWRRRLWERVPPGKGLEVGVGTGTYYPARGDVTAIDLSPKMLERASRRASTLGLHVDFHVADMEHLDFPDDSFDWVVRSFVCARCPIPCRAFGRSGGCAGQMDGFSCWSTCAPSGLSSGY